MTYHAGIGPGLPIIPACDPHVRCDGCGTVFKIAMDRAPPVWLLNRQAPRGWKATHDVTADHDRMQHWCPRCRHLAPAPQTKVAP